MDFLAVVIVMVTIDLSVIKPLDVILTTTRDGTGVAIRAAQTLALGKYAGYSHAAIFIAPTLIYESGDNDIDFNNLVEAPNGLHWANLGGRVTLCAVNAKWSDAVVVRRKGLTDVKFPFMRCRLNRSTQHRH